MILQRYLPGEQVTIYTRPPGAPTADEMWVQRGGVVSRRPRDTLARKVEQAIGATGGADVELVGDWIVQARPIVHPTVAPRVPPPPRVLAPLADGRTWTWDVTHNPDPLSPAQAELVARVERAGVAPWSLRVCGGYSRDRTNREDSTTGRALFGGHAGNVFGTGLDVSGSDSRVDRATRLEAAHRNSDGMAIPTTGRLQLARRSLV